MLVVVLPDECLLLILAAAQRTFLEEKTSLTVTMESDFISLLLQRQHAMLRSGV